MKRPSLLLLPFAVLVLAGLLRLLAPERPATPPPLTEGEIEETELRHARAARLPRLSRRHSDAVRAPRPGEPAKDTSASLQRNRRELTGYLVDDFRSWTALPPGYRAENIRLAGGGITVEPAADPEQTRSGVLLSPPLPLRPPPGGRPGSPGRELPPGSSLNLEIRLSRDGSDWTDWALVERHTAPDGPLTPLPSQSDPADLEAWQDSTTTGPTIQYRLTLTVGSGGAPTLRDLRIWHEGPARLERELSIHSPALAGN